MTIISSPTRRLVRIMVSVIFPWSNFISLVCLRSIVCDHYMAHIVRLLSNRCVCLIIRSFTWNHFRRKFFFLGANKSFWCLFYSLGKENYFVILFCLHQITYSLLIRGRDMCHPQIKVEESVSEDNKLSLNAVMSYTHL